MTEQAPIWYRSAKEDIGLREIPGPKSSPRILELAKKAQVDWYKNDDTSWCAIFVNGTLAEAGFAPTGNAMARGFETSPQFRRLDEPYEGCVTTFWRKSPDSGFGHTGFFVKEDEGKDEIVILGGNQGRAGEVSVAGYPADRWTGFWEPVGYNREFNSNDLPSPINALTFAGKALPMTPGMFQQTAARLECPPSMVAATWKVETPRGSFFPGGRPQILWEAHVFYDELPAAKREDAVRAGLAVPKWSPSTQYKNQTSAGSRYDIVIRAAKLDRVAAFNSFSMGGPQIVGKNYRLAGFTSAEDMFMAMRESEDAHFEAFINFVRSAGLVDEMQRRDYVGFTRGYNGRGQVDEYAPILRRYDEEFSESMPDHYQVPLPDLPENSITMGKTGERVRHFQERLVKFGYKIGVDGDFGPETKMAVENFQRKYNIDVRDHARGVLTPATQRALNEVPPVRGEWSPKSGGQIPDESERPKSILGRLILALIRAFSGREG